MFIVRATQSPTKSTSNSESLLLIGKLYLGAYANSISSVLLRTNPAPLCFYPADPSTYRIQAFLGSRSYGLVFVSMVLSKVFSTMKSASTCACLVFLNWKSIWYSLNSSAHLVIWPVRSGLCITYRRGTFVSKVTRCAWKYSFSFWANTTRQKMCFSNGLYCVSASASTWLI